MKKVLALVLAVIMVCTMAFALKVGGDPIDENSEDTGVAVNPGTVIAITEYDVKTVWGMTLAEDTFAPEIKNADDKVIAKNKLTVTFGKGSDLVASQGWVEVAEDVWEYQIALKENDTAKLDEKVDLSIAKVTLKATGAIKDQVATFDGKTEDDGHYAKILFDVGYPVVEIGLDEDAEIGFSVLSWDELEEEFFEGHDGVSDYRGIIVKVVKGKSTSTSGKLVLDYGNYIAEAPLKVGQEFFISFVHAKDWTKKELAKQDGSIDGFNPTSLTPVVKVGEYSLIDWTDDMNVYAKNFRTGKLVKLNETVEDGVVSFTAPAFSLIASVEGTLAGATAETGTETGTTNPGTGANDVVGVAAALAVVALVSGAAISLKK